MLAYVVMGFGALIALIGVVLFAKKGAEGDNKIKLLGMEFQLTGSALVVFVMGVITFLVPVIYAEKFQIHAPNESTADARDGANSEKAAVAGEIRQIAARVLGIASSSVDPARPIWDQADDSENPGMRDLIVTEICLQVEARFEASVGDEVKVLSVNMLADQVLAGRD
jgi:hypothetical protein